MEPNRIKKKDHYIGKIDGFRPTLLDSEADAVDLFNFIGSRTFKCTHARSALLCHDLFGSIVLWARIRTIGERLHPRVSVAFVLFNLANWKSALLSIKLHIRLWCSPVRQMSNHT